MFWADYIVDPPHQGDYLVTENDPVTGFLWNLCMDWDEDGDIDDDDYYAIYGNLFFMNYFDGVYWYQCGDPRVP